MDKDFAEKSFELENEIILRDSSVYLYDVEEQKRLREEAPWKKDPNYFQVVNVSAVALLKMVTHARSGGSIEVMGMMTGKVSGKSIVIMDAFPLPVEGTETRVNAQEEAYGFMVDYLTSLKAVGRNENIIGWYHSHPGYGCWLSGIDVNTQYQNQLFQDPFVAIVIDPNRTIVSGKVEIGAFRTYPEDYKPSYLTSRQAYKSKHTCELSNFYDDNAQPTIPTQKIKDYGAHASRYYSLAVTNFKSSTDSAMLSALWEKYWAHALSTFSLSTNFSDSSTQASSFVSNLEHFHSYAMSNTNQNGTRSSEIVIRGSKTMARSRGSSSLLSSIGLPSSSYSAVKETKAHNEFLEANRGTFIRGEEDFGKIGILDPQMFRKKSNKTDSQIENTSSNTKKQSNSSRTSHSDIIHQNFSIVLLDMRLLNLEQVTALLAQNFKRKLFSV